jgi:hypothetical protein
MHRQVREFIGLDPKLYDLWTPASTLILDFTRSAAFRLTPKSVTPNSLKPGLDSAFWRESLVRRYAKLLCTEVSLSVRPYALRAFVKKNVELDSKLAEVFCFSTWTAPVVCDYSSNGAYSNGIAARIYNQAAERMPRLLLLAAFSKKDVVQNMQGFMDNWERAESRFTKDDLALLGQIDVKDRGPFLYWLLNERCLSVGFQTVACEDRAPSAAGGPAVGSEPLYCRCDSAPFA